jgi:hypothetical protein
MITLSFTCSVRLEVAHVLVVSLTMSSLSLLASYVSYQTVKLSLQQIVSILHIICYFKVIIQNISNVILKYYA